MNITNKSKWQGRFKFIWSITTSIQSLVLVFNASTNKGKLILDSSIYFVQPTDSSIEYKKENISKEISKDEELSKCFPQQGTSMESGETSDYWGFKPEIDKICKNSECPSETEKTVTSISWKWSKKENGNGNAITVWSKNFNGWFSNLFESKWDGIKGSLEKIKGDWTKRGD